MGVSDDETRRGQKEIGNLRTRSGCVAEPAGGKIGGKTGENNGQLADLGYPVWLIE